MESPILSIASCPSQLLDPFSLVPYPEDGWARVKARKCCTESESLIAVNWVDVDFANHATTKRFTSLAELKDYTTRNESKNCALRVISLNQDNSWKPLKVTTDVLSAVMNLTDASPELLDIISCFYKRNDAIEEAYCNAPFFKCSAEKMEIAYIFKYISYKGNVDGKDPWSIRQTGVYQRYNFATKSSTWIFVHPAKESAFQTRIEQQLASPGHCSHVRDNPLLLHNLFISTCFPRWRDFMAYYESRILTLHNTIMGTSIDEPLRINHQALTTVIFIENRFLTLRTILHSVRKTFEALQKANNSLSDAHVLCHPETVGTSQLLDNYLNQLDAYTHQVTFLHIRAGRTAQLITDTLSFKNALTAQDQSKYMLSLTSSTVEDSTTVRTITIVTLIFLPSTFMATVLGMDSFFEMDSKSHSLVVSRQFWIYIVCAIPLTLVTVLCWWLRRKRQEKPNNQKTISMA